MKLEISRMDGDKVYKLNYSSLTDVHDYLSSNPKVNKRIFKTLASKKEDSDFAGEPLNKAIKYCIEGYSEGLEDFLSVNEELKKAGREISDNRKMERGLYGGIPLAPLVAAGVPDCMSRYTRESNENVRNIYYNIGCPWYTTSNQITNKGLITLYIVQALEERGEMVNFRAFEASQEGDEIIDIEVALKRPGEAMLDVGKCYFPLVRKEFLRRLLFRTLESMPVENSWSGGYGRPLSYNELKEFLKTKPGDIILSYPGELGISGHDIYSDTIEALEKLELTNEFDINKIKKLRR